MLHIYFVSLPRSHTNHSIVLAKRYLANSSSSRAVIIRLTITIIRPTIINVTPTPNRWDLSPSIMEFVIIAENTIRKPSRIKTTPRRKTVSEDSGLGGSGKSLWPASPFSRLDISLFLGFLELDLSTWDCLRFSRFSCSRRIVMAPWTACILIDYLFGCCQHCVFNGQKGQSFGWKGNVDIMVVSKQDDYFQSYQLIALFNQQIQLPYTF